MRAAELAARDGWACWLCGGAIDPAAPAGTPWSASVDHVVPRSRGGGNEPANARLAHRRCNGRRGNRAAELHWPDDFAVHEAAPLWQALARLARRPGRMEVVAVVPTAERAAAAADWVTERATLFLGGVWEAVVEPAREGDDGPVLVRLGVRAGSAPRDAGRPLPPRSGR